MDGFFLLQGSRGMLSKLSREHERLKESPNHIDNVFNFFVTAHHIRDYLEKEGRVPIAYVDSLWNEQDMIDCADMCNKGKHMKLELGRYAPKKGKPNPIFTVHSGAIGAVGINEAPINAESAWEIYFPDERRYVAIIPLAERTISRLHLFFSENDL